MWSIFRSTLERYVLNAQLAAGRGGGHLSSITPGRRWGHQAGQQLVEQGANGEGDIVVGEAEQEGDHKALQTDQDHGEHLVEVIQLGPGIRPVGQQEVLQPEERYQDNGGSYRLPDSQRSGLGGLGMQLPHDHPQNVDQKN